MPTINKAKPNELKLTRVYDAPVEMVWDAWTDPEQVAKWWGPRGFTITTHSKDLRPGGHWDYTMHGPDGVDYPNHTKYYEVVRHEKLVYDHGGNADRPPLFRVTALFSKLKGDRTQFDMTMSLATPEAAAEIREFVRKAGGNSTWDRLAEYLEKGKSGKETFVLNRAFHAPIETMFEMWTDPKHLAKWLAPGGATMEFLKADIKPGGTTLSMMSGPGGSKMYGRAEYLEISKPHRIVYKQQFCDEHGNVARHPLAATWPETMLTTVTLTTEAPDHTRVTITWEPFGEVLSEELATFVKARGNMTQGWTASLDGLEAYLGG